MFIYGCGSSNYSGYKTIILKGSAKVDLFLGNKYKDPGIKKTSGKLVINNNVNSSKLGDYNITYILKDSNGKLLDKKARFVKVIKPNKIIKHLNLLERKCDSNENIYFDNFVLNNNDWGRNLINTNSDRIQCIFSFLDKNITKSGFYWAWPNDKGGVKGYPEVIYGKKFSKQFNEDSNLPALVDNINSIDVDLAYRELNVTGSNNIAIETWLHTNKKTSIGNIKYEVMIRLDPSAFHPNRTWNGRENIYSPWINDVLIDGYHFRVYKNEPKKGKQFINFVAKEKITKINFDMKNFINCLIDNGYEDMKELYLSDIEFGIEVINGSGAILVDKFNVNSKICSKSNRIVNYKNNKIISPVIVYSKNTDNKNYLHSDMFYNNIYEKFTTLLPDYNYSSTYQIDTLTNKYYSILEKYKNRPEYKKRLVKRSFDMAVSNIVENLYANVISNAKIPLAKMNNKIKNKMYLINKNDNIILVNNANFYIHSLVVYCVENGKKNFYKLNFDKNIKPYSQNILSINVDKKLKIFNYSDKRIYIIALDENIKNDKIIIAPKYFFDLSYLNKNSANISIYKTINSIEEEKLYFNMLVPKYINQSDIVFKKISNNLIRISFKKIFYNKLIMISYNNNE